ncbi:zinc-binding alcohol dehydrogenase family protein [Corallococcus praedator]|uniref:Zinc-type alcohol dehydrogenase-like protein n=1 Tax=Corallococcus praedator TaxID=2316724 RepID=A0ABX9QNK7_9BACT|nr:MULTISPECIES: zinc-binding alcohol dehydrogenase family protein [Corallococcus]RKH33610.1 zinc-binding alcohol dehydrogenase family protein [Corallococcus sp. CA031C]RKI14814.1 zinc-binding alcohol dehydrogenase family protein [Corallococcus praedator]
MRAVALYKYLPSDHPEALVDVALPTPTPGPGDLLVRVHAVSVNPVDTKVRAPKAKVETEPRVLGWDAAGVVEAVGADVKRFRPGDEVYYAGSIARPGTNSELHVVDARIVGRKPRSLSFAQAAALPLTSITAWELLFERLGVSRDKGAPKDALLIVGGAGGVGSLATQLARQLTNLTVIATASRPETVAWCTGQGAHHVVDHRQPLAKQVLALAPEGVRYVLALTATEQHFAQLVEAMAPFGQLGIIDDPQSPLDVSAMKRKSLALHWELMFTRALFNADPLAQQRLLDSVADLVDAGTLKTTMVQDFGPITAANLRRAHAAVETGRTVGKIVLSGFP